MRESNWTEQLSAQANGFYAFFLFCAIVAIIYILLSRQQKPDSTGRTISRIIATILFFVLLVAEPISLFYLFVLWLAWTVFKHWIPALKKIPLPYQLILLAGLARLPLMNEALWYDETFTAGVAQLPLANLFKVVSYDVHPPLWYLIEFFTIRLFGSGEAALRLPAYIAGLITALAIYRLTIALKLGDKVALTAALLTCFWPAHVYYSTEARGYSLLALLIILCLIAILEKRPLLFLLSSIFLPLLHAIGYLWIATLLMLYVGLFLYRRQSHKEIKPEKGDLIAIIPSITISLSYLPFLLKQSQDVKDGFWLQFHGVEAVRLLNEMSIAWRIPISLTIALNGSIVVLTILSLYASRRWLEKPLGLIFLLAVITTPALTAIISIVWNPIYLNRALLASPLLLTIPIAYAYHHLNLGDRFTLRLLLIPTIAISYLAMLGFFGEYGKRAPMGDYINDSCQYADAVFTASTAVKFIADYYAPESVNVSILRYANDLNQHLPNEAKEALSWQQVDNLPPGKTCILHYDTALSSQLESDFIADSISNNSLIQSKQYSENGLGAFSIYLVEVMP